MCVFQGHVDEMWGLAVHPSQNIFLTCGHDRQVCLWKTEEHKLDWCITLEVGFTLTFLELELLIICEQRIILPEESEYNISSVQQSVIYGDQ